jgi:hypothetical protein
MRTILATTALAIVIPNPTPSDEGVNCPQNSRMSTSGGLWRPTWQHTGRTQSVEQEQGEGGVCTRSCENGSQIRVR